MVKEKKEFYHWLTIYTVFYGRLVSHIDPKTLSWYENTQTLQKILRRAKPTTDNSSDDKLILSFLFLIVVYYLLEMLFNTISK